MVVRLYLVHKAPTSINGNINYICQFFLMEEGRDGLYDYKNQTYVICTFVKTSYTFELYL